MNIRKFYSIFQKNTKRNLIFLVLIIFHFTLLVTQTNKAKETEKNKNFHKFALKIQAKINSNLMGPCNFFKSEGQVKTSLEFELSRIGIKLEVSKSLISKVSQFSFYEIQLRLSKKQEQNVQSQAIGYLVENTINQSCFGLI